MMNQALNPFKTDLQDRDLILKDKILKGINELTNCRLIGLSSILDEADKSREVYNGVEIILTHSVYNDMIAATLDGRSVDMSTAFIACRKAYKNNNRININNFNLPNGAPIYEAYIDGFIIYFVVEDDESSACVLCIDRQI